jgi:phospholipase/carboxylesterase
MTELSLRHRVRPSTSRLAPNPGVLLLHGLGSNEEDLHSIAPFLDHKIVVISARAPLNHRWGGFSWYDLDGEGPGLGGATIDRTLNLLASFIGEIQSAYDIDPTRLYVGGFSMGAAMAAALLLLFPERIAGAVIISGYLPPDIDPPRYRVSEVAGKPVFQAHGTNDSTGPLHAAHMTRDYLRKTSVDLTYREYAVGHSVSHPELNDLAAWFDNVLTRHTKSR